VKDQLGTDHVELEVPTPIHLNQLRKELENRYPIFKGMVGRWAVNLNFVPGDALVKETDEIAWIPPVSGG